MSSSDDTEKDPFDLVGPFLEKKKKTSQQTKNRQELPQSGMKNSLLLSYVTVED